MIAVLEESGIITTWAECTLSNANYCLFLIFVQLDDRKPVEIAGPVLLLPESPAGGGGEAGQELAIDRTALVRGHAVGEPHGPQEVQQVARVLPRQAQRREGWPAQDVS